MARVSYVLAFDLATRTGWAKGAPGDTMPMSGAVTLKRPNDVDGTLEHNMGALFVDLVRDRKPDLVIWETPMTPEAWFQLCIRQGRPQNGGSLILQNVLGGILKRECGRKDIPFLYVARQSVLKHFTGRPTWSSGKGAGDGRELGKAAVLKRCHQLRYLPDLSKDEDRADACALFDFAASTYGGRIPAELAFFDEGKLKHG